MRLYPPLARTLRASFLATVTVLAAASATPAAAHSALESSAPVDESTLKVFPKEVALHFNQEISPNFAVVSLQAPQSRTTTRLNVTVAGKQLSAPIPAPSNVPAGQWTVAYRVTSADGHPITGSISFTAPKLTAPVQPEIAPVETPRPQPSASQTPASAGSADESPDPSSGSTTAVIFVGLGSALAVVGVLVALLRRERRSA